MDKDKVASYIDFSLLSPVVGRRDIELALATVVKRGYPLASVCVPPLYTPLASTILGSSPVKVSTVVGFPLGYTVPRLKVGEALEAIGMGADELDVVMNISAFKSGDLYIVEDELKAITSLSPGTLVKVIIECCCLTDEEKREAVDLVARSGAHYVKTSTGFGSGGATLSDVRLLKEASGGRVRVKAAGGIKSLSDLEAMVEAGAERVGSSSAIEIISGL